MADDVVYIDIVELSIFRKETYAEDGGLSVSVSVPMGEMSHGAKIRTVGRHIDLYPASLAGLKRFFLRCLEPYSVLILEVDELAYLSL